MYIDFHNDTILKIIYEDGDFDSGSAHMSVDLPKIQAQTMLGGLFFAVCCDSIFKGGDALDQTSRMLEILKKTLERNSDYIEIACKKGDLEAVVNRGKVAAFLAIEGGHAINNSLENLGTLYDQGVRLMTLTHWAATDWAGSLHQDADRGLSSFGREVVASMNDLGMIVDVAHTSEPAVFDTVESSKFPVVCSHGSVKRVFDNDRALSDETIRAISESGGVIGITFFPEALVDNPHVDSDSIAKVLSAAAEIERDETLTVEQRAHLKHKTLFGSYKVPDVIPDIEAVFRHVDSIANFVGIDHVALGSDFDGIPYYCKGLEDITKLGNFAGLLAGHGYSGDDVEKIMGGNILRVINHVIK